MSSPELDQAADAAAEVLRQFRRKHWGYFYSTERICPETGAVLPRRRIETLDRESARLFEIVRKANKAALEVPDDLE